MAQTKKVSFDYDDKADVLYITLNTGEPSYSEEVDDILLVEKGMFSNQITGFRIMDAKEHNIKEINLILHKKIPNVFAREAKSIPQQLKTREERLRAIIKELNTEKLFKV